VHSDRVKLVFAPGLEVEFTDRDRGIRQVYELAERGTRFPLVVYGPEGCGKSAWLRQVAEILKNLGFDVIYVDLAHREYVAYTDIREVASRITEVLADVTGIAPIKLADLVVLLANQLLKKWRKKRIALLVDEVFQAIGLDRAEIYVKMLLNLIEYPPAEYEKIVAIVTTSEGASRAKIGRHSWAWLMSMWNMSKSGFTELYEKIPGSKLSSEDAWRLTSGNPRALSQLYRSEWSLDIVVNEVISSRSLHTLIRSLSENEKQWLFEATEDPDTLLRRERLELLSKLVELNMVTSEIAHRDPELWVDEPPPERDLALGIGKHVAWQTPLHREAVKRVLELYN
jgi:hypothetical protein